MITSKKALWNASLFLRKTTFKQTQNNQSCFIQCFSNIISKNMFLILSCCHLEIVRHFTFEYGISHWTNLLDGTVKLHWKQKSTWQRSDLSFDIVSSSYWSVVRDSTRITLFCSYFLALTEWNAPLILVKCHWLLWNASKKTTKKLTIWEISKWGAKQLCYKW